MITTSRSKKYKFCIFQITHIVRIQIRYVCMQMFVDYKTQGSKPYEAHSHSRKTSIRRSFLHNNWGARFEKKNGNEPQSRTTFWLGCVYQLLRCVYSHLVEADASLCEFHCERCLFVLVYVCVCLGVAMKTTLNETKIDWIVFVV